MNKFTKQIERTQTSAIKVMLQSKYNCNSCEVMEINDKQIIQVEQTTKQDYFDIEQDITEILNNIATPFSYKVTFNGKDTTIVSIKALA